MRRVAVEHWRYGGWLLATVLATWGASQLYPFLISSIGAAAVASFAASRNLLNGVSILVQTANNYLPTRMRQVLDKQGHPALLRLSRKAALYFGLIALAFCSFIALFAEPMLAIVYGKNYISAAPLMRVLSIGTFFTAIGAIVGAHALAIGETRSSFISNAVAAVFTFSVGIAATATWGIVGAAWAASGSLCIAVLTQIAIISRKSGRRA